MDEQAGLTVIKQQSRCALGFYKHLAVYLIFNIGVLAQMYSAEFFVDSGLGNAWSWSWTIGWGIGLAVHGAWVYLFRRQCSLDLAER